MWDGPVRPGSGGAGRSGREPWAPEGKVLGQKQNMTKQNIGKFSLTMMQSCFRVTQGYGGRLR